MRQPRYSDIFAGHDEGAAMAETAKVLWHEYREDLESRKLWTHARARTLDRLVRATVEYQTLYPRAAAEGPIATAPSGGEYFSYLWAAVHKLSDQIAKLEKALMLTPEAIGDRTAPKEDRAPCWSAADEFLKPH